MKFGGREMHDAYQPVIEDGRGRFPEDLRVKVPRGARAAIAAAAQAHLAQRVRPSGTLALP